MIRLLSILILFSALSLTSRAQSEDTDEETVSESTKLRLPTGVGKYLVGANILLANATFQKGSEASYSVGLNPKIGIFVLPNIALGLSGNLHMSGNKSFRTINYGLSPFARVYFAHNNEDRPTRPLQVFVEGGVGFGGTNTRYNTTANPSVSTNGVRLYLLPGVDYFINDRIAAELGLEYLFIGGKPDAHTIGINLGFQIFLGR